MANLKLIKVTGSPFCSTLYGCIGIQVNDDNFNVIKGGELNHQLSSNGFGWEYATAEEIAENWKLIYPHWKPEPGDNVIITQDYGSWTNQRATIVEASSTEGYWRVKRKEGNLESFDYTCQMILAPTISTTSSTSTITETKSESSNGWRWQDLKVGDNVKIIGGDSSYRPIGAILTIDRMESKDYRGNQPIRLIGSDGEDKGWPYIGTFEPYYGDIKPSEPSEFKDQTKNNFKIGDHVRVLEKKSKVSNKIGKVIKLSGPHVGIEFNHNVDGHSLSGFCEEGYGWWVLHTDVELISKPETKSETESKPEEKTMRKFKIGDRVQCINSNVRGYGKIGTIRAQSSDTSDTSIGVEFDEDIDGHSLDNRCPINHGWWIFEKDLELAPDSKPKSSFELGDYVKALEGPFVAQIGVIREQRAGRFGVEFPEKSGRGGHDLNGKCKHGYGWYYDSTEIVAAASSAPAKVVESTFSVDSEPERRFREGDKVSYKSTADCPGAKYEHGGTDQEGFVGTVSSEGSFLKEKGCYKIQVTTKSGCTYTMLESEFKEFDSSYSGTMHVPECSTASVLTIPTSSILSDPLDAYKQVPITIKKKPKTKLTITTI